MLNGLLVLDLSRRLPGPLCGQMLGDLGADVIKIEDTKSGDEFRSSQPLYNGWGCQFHMVNRNKQGMRLNLSTIEGRDIFKKLIIHSDILISGMRPRTMNNWGLDYENLQEINPRLIYCSLTGYGQDGPYSEFPSHDINILGISGILGLIGEKNGKPVIPGVQIAGVAGGTYQACIGILAALYKRQISGKGCFLDIALLDGITPLLSMPMAEYLAGGEMPQRGKGSTRGDYAHYRIYETLDGKYLALGCLEPKYWQNFCRAIDREDLIQRQYQPHPDQQQVIEIIEKIMKGKTREEWLSLLNRTEICISPVNSLKEVIDDPQIRFRNLWFKREHPVSGDVGQQAFPFTIDQNRPGWRRGAPSHGEHSRAILKELGYSDTEIDTLQNNNVI